MIYEIRYTAPIEQENRSLTPEQAAEDYLMRRLWEGLKEVGKVKSEIKDGQIVMHVSVEDEDIV